MRIDGFSGFVGRPKTEVSSADNAQEAKSVHSVGEGASHSTGETSSQVSRFTELKSRLGDIPEVRQSVVDRVKSRLADGYYSTSQAAQDTAQAILNGPTE
ncbi:MAG: flagellar biosynthesis anti-sigma factor FlgM [Planctomycetales bacterium]|nr:flagellar biosynthesis anti-sigma factor FlgM [Planctomycetales bacterium]